jgi:hypothetical protein
MANEDIVYKNYQDYLDKCFPGMQEVHIRVIVPSDASPYDIFDKLVEEAKRFCLEKLDPKNIAKEMVSKILKDQHV